VDGPVYQGTEDTNPCSERQSGRWREGGRERERERDGECSLCECGGCGEVRCRDRGGWLTRIMCAAMNRKNSCGLTIPLFPAFRRVMLKRQLPWCTRPRTVRYSLLLRASRPSPSFTPLRSRVGTATTLIDACATICRHSKRMQLCLNSLNGNTDAAFHFASSCVSDAL
jgi:hypothetical protein